MQTILYYFVIFSQFAKTNPIAALCILFGLFIFFALVVSPLIGMLKPAKNYYH
jgi:hypothetical protein